MDTPLKATFQNFLNYFSQHYVICRPKDLLLSGDTGIELYRTFAIFSLAVLHSNYSEDLIHSLAGSPSHSARSHPQLG